VGETVDLQISGCELHKNESGGRAPCGPAGGAVALPRPPSCYKRERREGRGKRVGNREREMGEEKEGREEDVKRCRREGEGRM